MCNTFDIIIIGSGPSGSMTAIEAARKGLHVALLEKESLPRRKVCAGGLVRRAIDLLPKEVEYPVQHRCDAVELHFKDSNLKFKQETEGIVTMVCRSAFDYALVKHAQSLGVMLIEKIVVTEVSPQDTGVKILSNQADLFASYIVFAEGANARLSNQFWKDDRKLIPSIEADVYVSEEILNGFQISALFDFDVVPDGYGWVFPKRDHLSIGLATCSRKSVHLQKHFDLYIQHLNLGKDITIKNRKGFIIPVSPRTEPLMKQRMLLVGDTAGLADPISAEGLTHAIQSGMLAGQSISKNFDNPELVTEAYLEAIQPILDELHAANKLSKLIYFVNPMVRKMLFKRHGTKLCRGMTQVIEGKRSYVKALGSSKLLARVLNLTQTS